MLSVRSIISATYVEMGKPNSFCFLLHGPCYIFIYKNICSLQTRHFWVLHLLSFPPIHFCIREGSLDLLSLLFHVDSLPASHPLKLKLRFLKFVLSCSRDGFSLYQQARRLLTTLQMNLEIKNPNQKPKLPPRFLWRSHRPHGVYFLSQRLKGCHHEAIEPWNEIVIEYKSCITFNTRAACISHSSSVLSFSRLIDIRQGPPQLGCNWHQPQSGGFQAKVVYLSSLLELIQGKMEGCSIGTPSPVENVSG